MRLSPALASRMPAWVLPVMTFCVAAAEVPVRAASTAPGASEGTPRIEASLKKDEKSGRIEGRAEMNIDLPPAAIWPVLTEAIHGKLSDRTHTCIDVPPERAKAFLKRHADQLLPVPDAREKSARETLTRESKGPFPPVAKDGFSTRYALRVISVPIPFTSDRWFLARETFDASRGGDGLYTVAIEGRAGNISHYDGRWSLEPTADGKTRVTLSVLSDMGIPTPGFLTGLGAGELRESLKRLNRLALAAAGTSESRN